MEKMRQGVPVCWQKPKFKSQILVTVATVIIVEESQGFQRLYNINFSQVLGTKIQRHLRHCSQKIIL